MFVGYFFLRVMLNSASGAHIFKKENKVKVNVEKITFYNFEALNTQISALK
jgi:hypothetical protein